jgi:hypothetical protein
MNSHPKALSPHLDDLTLNVEAVTGCL